MTMKLNIFDSKSSASSNVNMNASGRLVSLDALRGFDMMWIISGEIIVHALAKATNAPGWNWMSDQLHHSVWNGFTFYDMIFPLFIFIAGISMPFSFGKQLDDKSVTEQKKAKIKIYTSLIKRTLILIICGMVVNGLFKWQGYENTRFASVLGRIALSCFFAAILFLNTSLRSQLIWFAAILLGYWAIMMLIPVPGYGAGILTPEGNLGAYVDRLFLPGKLHRVVYDPEGILSTIPAIATALLGVLTGQFLRLKSDKWTLPTKGIMLALAGVLCLMIGLLWNMVFPINKNMWTSSFVLFAGGWSLLLLSLFYFIIEVADFKKWSLPFIWIGTNSILIYMAAHGVINFEYTATYLFGGLINFTPLLWQPVWLGCGILIIQLALVYFLYKKKWFLKV
jgi:predicted acyltransferase